MILKNLLQTKSVFILLVLVFFSSYASSAIIEDTSKGNGSIVIFNGDALDITDITLEVSSVAKIVGLEEVVFPEYNGQDVLEITQSLCIYTNADEYSISASSGSGSGDSMSMKDKDGNVIKYSVSFNGSDIGGGNSVSQGNSGDDAGCNTQNDTLVVSIDTGGDNEESFDEEGGVFTDILTLIISPV